MKTTFSFDNLNDLYTPSEGVGAITPEIGAFSSGWIGDNKIFGETRGVLDLGKNGKLTVTIPLPDAKQRKLTMKISYYKDSALFAKSVPIVKAKDWNFVSREVYADTTPREGDTFFASRFDMDVISFEGSFNEFVATVESPSKMPFVVLVNKIEVEANDVDVKDTVITKDVVSGMVKEVSDQIFEKNNQAIDNVNAIIDSAYRETIAQLQKLEEDINKLIK